MTDGISDTSFYRLPKESQIKPKIFYDKDQLKAQRNDDKIDYLPEKVAKIKNEKEIKLESIEKEWRDGMHNSKDINTNPFHNLKSLNGYYNEPDLTIQLPMYVPSDRILLNTPAGIHQQWKIFLEKNGQL